MVGYSLAETIALQYVLQPLPVQIVWSMATLIALQFAMVAVGGGTCKPF